MDIERRSLLTGSAALLAASLASPLPAGAAPRRAGGRLQAFARARMAQYHMPGLAISVTRDQRLLDARGFGLADVEFNIPMTADTVLFCASSSKIMAGIATMILVEQGRLSLDQPVIELIPEFPSSWGAIRVHHLLEHTSGIPAPNRNERYRTELAARERAETFVGEEKLDRFTAEETIGYLRELPLAYEPGLRFEYGFTSYFIVGEIIRRLSGIPYYERFVETRILRPLGMNRTRYGNSYVVVPGRRSTNYSIQTGPLRNWVYPYNPLGYPAAGMNAPVTDFARLFPAIARGAILSRAGWERMWVPARLNDGSESNYGLGWALGERNGRRVVGHEGGGCSWIGYYPAEKLGVAAICNLAGARADNTEKDIGDLYLR